MVVLIYITTNGDTLFPISLPVSFALKNIYNTDCNEDEAKPDCGFYLHFSERQQSFFMCPLVIYVSPLEKYPLIYFAH